MEITADHNTYDEDHNKGINDAALYGAAFLRSSYMRFFRLRVETRTVGVRIVD